MSFSRRLVIFGFFLLLLLLAGMLFWPFIFNEIIRPISLVAWLLLRIFVLSIAQQYFWAAIIFVAVIFIYRLLAQDRPAVRVDEAPETNATIKNIRYWRILFTLAEQDAQDDKTLKRELIRLLLSLYATKQRTSANFGMYEALQRGDIPLPEHIHTFLFSEEPQGAGRSLKKRLQSFVNAPRMWIDRLTGQKAAERCRMIEEVLGFMETALEMKNDEGKLEPN